MVAAARVVGLLVLAFSGAGLLFTGITFDPAPLEPLWSGQVWTAAARRALDWAAYGALGLGGLVLRLSPKEGMWPLSLAVLVVAAMVGHDVLASDPDVVRQREMLKEDAVLAAVAAASLFAVALVFDAEEARKEE